MCYFELLNSTKFTFFILHMQNLHKWVTELPLRHWVKCVYLYTLATFNNLFGATSPRRKTSLLNLLDRFVYPAFFYLIQ